MSLDATVWLIAGLGLGVAGSLALLILYAAFERLRLARRLRRGRTAVQLPIDTDPVLDAEDGDTAVSSGDLPARAESVKRAAPSAAAPLAAELAAPEPPKPDDVVATLVVEVTPIRQHPAEQAPRPVPARSLPDKPQSVEELFAEAFALDRVAVAPLATASAASAIPEDGQGQGTDGEQKATDNARIVVGDVEHRRPMPVPGIKKDQDAQQKRDESD